MLFRHALTLASAATIAVPVAVVTLVGSARPAQAIAAGSPPCYGASCVGKNPNITNAAGMSCASTAVDIEPTLYVEGDADIAVRWSSWCGANWVRWESSAYYPGANQFYVQSADGLKQYNGPAYSYYTPMANGTETVVGCAVYPDPGCLGPY